MSGPVASDAFLIAGSGVVGIALGELLGLVRDWRKDRHADEVRDDEQLSTAVLRMDHELREVQRALDQLVNVPERLDEVREWVAELRGLVKARYGVPPGE